MISRLITAPGLSARAGMLVGLAATALAGCGTEETAAVQFRSGEPDTSGAAVWQYLQSENYQSNWQTWPGKGKLYLGQQPHGALLTTYLNDIAYAALQQKAGQFPPGAIVVKENYMPDSTLAAITTMYKVQGYNPSAGNWFWVEHLPDGSVAGDGMLQGRVAMCINCHAARQDNDYIYTGSLK